MHVEVFKTGLMGCGVIEKKKRVIMWYGYGVSGSLCKFLGGNV